MFLRSARLVEPSAEHKAKTIYWRSRLVTKMTFFPEILRRKIMVHGLGTAWAATFN